MSYRNELTFGIDLGDLGVKVMQLKRTRSGIQADHIGEVTFEAGLMVSGEVKAAGPLAKRIKEVVGAARISANHAVAALPEAKTFSKLITIQRPPKEALEEKIKEEMEKHIPFTWSEIWWDMDIVYEAGGMLTAFVGIVPRTLVASWIDLLRASGLIPTALDLEAMAIARASTALKTPSGTLVLIADLGATKSTLLAAKDGAVLGSADLNISGQTLTEQIQTAMKLARPQEAESLKRSQGISGADAPYNDLMTSYRETLARGITRMIDGLAMPPPPQAQMQESTAASSAPIVMLSGGGAALKGLPEALQSALKLPVTILDPWAKDGNRPPSIAAPDAPRFATAAGLALYAFTLDHL